jgi:putative methyltransferase (TIGR04325 family)
LGALNRILTFARDVRGAARFRGRFYTNLYRGVYSSYVEAAQAIPTRGLKGFEHDAVIKFFEGEEGQWKYHDYPAAFWLRDALQTDSSVFDLGGGWGQAYYAYKDYIGFPKNLCWLVCDTPAFAERGREIAANRGSKHLIFTVDPADADGCGILITGGTLQYMEDDLPVILDRLEKKPNHIIAHRIPLYEGPQFYTVQRMVYSYAVNKVMNKEEFVNGVTRCGYTLRDSWAQSRSLKVMFHPERLVPDYSGFYFSLNNGSSDH